MCTQYRCETCLLHTHPEQHQQDSARVLNQNVTTTLVQVNGTFQNFAPFLLTANEYIDNTNYSGEFSEMNQLLREINENTKK